jgi:hypothetical protein
MMCLGVTLADRPAARDAPDRDVPVTLDFSKIHSFLDLTVVSGNPPGSRNEQRMDRRPRISCGDAKHSLTGPTS